ncbi:MAG: adenylosuccinate lyase [Candidatus Eremiobacteraeota bacterium]|nr:adenylosuccinate lyase [Candidatus Eremiobacteraeota bacterium]
MTAGYSSPFSWRYGSPAMRALWSEENKRLMWRRMWLALATAQSKAGLVSDAELSDLRRHVDAVDLAAAQTIEDNIGHDLMAELRVYASQAKRGGGKLHLGATSMDIEDNVDTARIRASLSLLAQAMRSLLAAFADKIDAYSDLACMGYTHLQAAEPTTLGYRISLWAQDVAFDYEALTCLGQWLPAKGMRGAVGTSASYAALLDGCSVSPEDMERDVLAEFDLHAVPITGQTYPRRLDYVVIAALGAFGASMAKFALDVRVLASSPFGELGEPFGKQQVGSSAMPFKRNPILCERINSLARLIAANVQVAWHNAAGNILERTLDDSANRRSMIPESFLAADELARLGRKVIEGLRVDEPAVGRNLASFGPFAATEAVLMSAAKAGADRQEVHEVLRGASMRAWEALGQGQANPLPRLLGEDAQIARYIHKEKLSELLDPCNHVGMAAQRARAFAEKLRALKPVGGSDKPATDLGGEVR